ncbi:DUF3290 domain-containing protein [Leuconostoc rapi]|uniref:DUF3290 domain-containing protein n=1 Tax=Leuconostoc rapi TaxID=1406906 RepID=UPI001959F1D0|nr:DUF3290 domain-containing protein [Leuconostoc rapi]MBM7435324.1 apolipoprotein N-acyltransferase [Leuconostoc rapi]
MTFYSVDYLTKHNDLGDTIGIYLMVIAFMLMAAGAFAAIRNRMQTKYRDLSMIALLLFLFLAGARYTDYEQARTNDSQITQMASFAKQVAKTQHVKTTALYFNQKTVSDGMLVRFNKRFYRMTISLDQQSYTLDRAYLINTKVNYIK